jgi:hypothetical protein
VTDLLHGQEAGLDVSKDETKYSQLYKILVALRGGDFALALECVHLFSCLSTCLTSDPRWAGANKPFLAARSSSLEFDLHRAQYIHLLLSSPTPMAALTYARTHLSAFRSSHAAETTRLLGALVYLPADRLRASPYSDLLADESRAGLAGTFAALWCASAHLPREPSLRVAADLGPAALARIEKGKKILGPRASWAARDELPIEIPLPAANRYHSVFTCPVSKEQASARNPPMMIGCGHVICQESLGRLAKTGGYVLRVPGRPCPDDSMIGT